ncbi:mandelate racemase/muconate lactonizing enzyme family protein [Fusibacter paucivorans]|uniref:Mandelate racemase/muconate lactonizing enzyme family protein n=1 Tax=Fusibacter paucivorans TaxID=76009 RepID=A0ABS5PNI8_9FIRM|nr:mandelate racemase/muconate lactonizing enzyme family protein [Fusibacter paucivorans]MBS7526447.1 mandelate racemase/muconate lactonizing enzyme family protein [Fusibacter paucivorans]
MKITSVDIFLVTIGRPSVKGSPWNPVVVRINTDEGISGYGEVGLAYGDTKEGPFGMVKDFAKLIIGMDPMNNEGVWNRLHNTFWGLGGGPVIYGAMSAIDIALWDIKGKALNVPVYQLLGGKVNQKLRAYASQIQFDWGPEAKALVHPEEYGEACSKAKEDGYNCIKVDPLCFNMAGKYKGWSVTGILQQDQLRIVRNRVKAIREAGGPDMDIIIEVHSLTDVNSAVQLAEAIREFGIFYFEEPTMPMNVSNMQQIARRTNLPIASGERIYTRWGYRPFFEAAALQIIQPDLGNCGGLTEGKKICDMARIYDVGVQAHVCGGPQATAAALHLEAAIDNFVIHEHHQAALLPENIMTGIYDYQPVNGYFEIPDLPGLGQELSERAMATAVKVTVK